MTVPEIKAQCEQLGIYPTKHRGQNFLWHDGTLDRIIRAAHIEAGEGVLEIGPGLGVLTKSLLEVKARVLAVELDRTLAPYIKKQFHDAGDLTVWQRDILDCSSREIAKALGGHFKIVANIPYNVTGAVLAKFMESAPRPTLVVLMVQHEVALRLTDKKRRSLGGILLEYFGAAEIVAKVPRGYFWPIPNVDSAIIRIIVHPPGFRAHDVQPVKLFPLIKAGFAHSRKQLVSNLASICGGRQQADHHLRSVGIDPMRRAETLSLADWMRLAKVIQ